jgi:F-type H+-transporting ATPase subunit gamma
MTERLSDVTARIASVNQLEAVITAMRGVAAARSHEARTQLDGIRAYARIIADAIGNALVFAPQPTHPGIAGHWPDGHAIVALCSDQGFCGAFNDRVLDAVGGMQTATASFGTELLLIGDRGLAVADERGLVVDWSAPMVAHTAQVAALAGRISEELYRRLDAGQISRVGIVHALPIASGTIDIAEKVLVPFDFGRFPLPRAAVPPLITLPPRVLLAGLAEEYVFAELCEAIMLSFAAENEARMQAMISARNNVEETLEHLTARARQLRQEDITNEIIELAGGQIPLR